ncbi:hypothetical protein BDV95DRAFT_441850, partial [Massariosphaeria phaeospora]
SAAPVSKDSRCGTDYKGQTCKGSTWGNCCSKYGYCGKVVNYCEPPTCQKNFGRCNG